MDMNRHSDDTAKLPLLTVSEVAHKLGCSQSNVYSLVEQGLLPVVCVGRQKGYRIAPADLDAFIDRRRVQHQAAEKPTPQPRLRHIKL